MPRTRSPVETDQITVTLPVTALAMLDRLVPVGLYGGTRGEVARALILSRLEDAMAKGILKPE